MVAELGLLTRLGSVPCIVVTSPELAKEFLKTHELSFINRSETTAVEKIPTMLPLHLLPRLPTLPPPPPP
ncbi:hypothetical protein ACLB2K_064266 [Fragaria x ananassa]